jgi:hypothetical protein
LAGIAARELDGSCSPGHPCSAADPIASWDHLAALLGRVIGKAGESHLLVTGPALSCTSEGGRERVQDRRVVRVAERGGPFLQNGSKRSRRTLASLLARAPLLSMLRRGDFYILLLLIAAAMAEAVVGLLW